MAADAGQAICAASAVGLLGPPPAMVTMMPGARPRPSRATVWEPAGSLSLMVSVPDVAPGEVGSEATVIVQLAPAASEVPQLLVSEKPPVVEMPLRVTAELPLFVRVTV